MRRSVAMSRAPSGRTGWSTRATTRKPSWSESEELARRRGFLKQALDTLNEREMEIFTARRLAEDPATLEDLSAKYNVSRERIRQIEVRAFEKVQRAVQRAVAAG